MENQKSQDRFITIKEVASMLGIAVSTAWAWVKTKAGFPAPVSLSARCTRFALSEVIAFKDSYLSARSS